MDSSREKMVKTAARLLSERGYAATSFQDVIARSGAPRGSIYHHFPGGKEQLAAEALRWYAERTRFQIPDGADPALTAVAGYFAATAAWLRKTEFRGGCPFAGVALDVSPGEPLYTLVAETFADWCRVLEHAFTAEGCPAPTARALASLVVAGAEGGLLLARAQRDTKPLDDVAAQVLAHLRATLDAHRPTPAPGAAAAR
ncbi:TetR family transcriptional regulator [Catellatospora sp. TT07R-123]|uniref:TetR/AcrR family transcriptional regulator n=1 Tax=Catellatospora sp. TT07R-123 TaxID=2733863 RepID=UPI001B0367DD|nr:TetR/AcrR family transcriptional regulator [Catellatospora sp. TT07R-123]GHJ48062.1 TetR family transcriptional regulator [Catellatospora sp. TT07R-123]